ncbi:hypothetical protein RB201_12965 [Streptomyces sp. S1A(2023)]
MTTTTLSTLPATRTKRTGFREALAYEWIKFRSVRSTVWTTAATAVLPVIGAVFIAATGSLQPDDTVLGGSLTLSVVAQMLAAVVGALVASGEYSSGTIRTTFAACPRRGTVLAAKATLVAGVMYPLALASCTAGYLVGGAMLPEGRYAQGEPLPALFGIAASFAVAAVLGLAVRHPRTPLRRCGHHGDRPAAPAVPVRPPLRRRRTLGRRTLPDGRPGKAHPDLGRRCRHGGQPGPLALPAPGRGQHGRRSPGRPGAASAAGRVRQRGSPGASRRTPGARP